MDAGKVVIIVINAQGKGAVKVSYSGFYVDPIKPEDRVRPTTSDVILEPRVIKDADVKHLICPRSREEREKERKMEDSETNE